MIIVCPKMQPIYCFKYVSIFKHHPRIPQPGLVQDLSARAREANKITLNQIKVCVGGNFQNLTIEAVIFCVPFLYRDTDLL